MTSSFYCSPRKGAYCKLKRLQRKTRGVVIDRRIHSAEVDISIDLPSSVVRIAISETLGLDFSIFLDRLGLWRPARNDEWELLLASAQFCTRISGTFLNNNLGCRLKNTWEISDWWVLSRRESTLNETWWTRAYVSYQPHLLRSQELRMSARIGHVMPVMTCNYCSYSRKARTKA